MVDSTPSKPRAFTVEPLSISRTGPSGGGGGGKKLVVSGGVGAMVECIIDNADREGFADATNIPAAEAGTYQTRSTVGIYARATTFEAKTGISILEAVAMGPNAVAGLHAGPSGVAAYAKAELVRAEASAAGFVIGGGVNVNTGASIGPDGAEISLLGFGVSVGPRMSLKTPIVDVSCIIT